MSDNYYMNKVYIIIALLILAGCGKDRAVPENTEPIPEAASLECEYVDSYQKQFCNPFGSTCGMGTVNRYICALPDTAETCEVHEIDKTGKINKTTCEGLNWPEEKPGPQG